MSKNNKIICFLAAIIIISSILLFIEENKTPYDKDTYKQVYKEYENITNIAKDSQSNKQEPIIKEGNATIIEQNNLNNKDIPTYAPIKKKAEYSTTAVINIPKINISYPVIKEYKESYLNIAPVKLTGPEPNTIGNFVIVAHNNLNKEFFSNLHKLKTNDIVTLTDTSGQKLTYKVYDISEVNQDDFNCLNQNTNGNIDLTLITCVKYKTSKRLVVKCTAI